MLNKAFIALVVCALGFAPPAFAAGKAERVVLIVWDGMRPDYVTEQTTPTLFKLAQSGVTFAHHHSVYPTSTEVNGTALATGVYPNRSGLMGNREYRPAINALKPIDTQDAAAIRKGDELTHGHYLAVPTLAETLQRAGLRTVVAGTKPVAQLQDRAETRVDPKSVVLFAGRTLPASAVEPIVAAQGVFPALQDFPDIAHNVWTARALTEQLWKDDVPKFSLLWLNEPDLSQHQTGHGSPLALAALRNDDEILASVLQALDARGLRETTDVLLVSDHGFSRVRQSVDLTGDLMNAGFPASREFKEPPKKGDVLVVGVGGSAFFYVIGHDESVTRKLVEFLQKTDYAGVLFARAKIAGTFPLAQARVDTPDAPDVVMAFRWNGEGTASTASIPSGDQEHKPRPGTHASLNPEDVHNTLIAAGPDFKRGWTDLLPTGNVDVAPTVLAILGVPPLQKMDGRVLEEAFVEARDGAASKQQSVNSQRILAEGKWAQHVMLTHLGACVYLDEGNGAWTAK